MTTDTSAASPSSLVDVLDQYVGRRATALQTGYLADRADAVATLARLRRIVPSGRQLDPDAWDIFDGMPEALLGSGDEPGRAELAAVGAIALFAVHQQSRRDAAMHQRGRMHSPGRAFGQLSRVTGAPGVERRFRALTRSADVTASLQHLRGLITQLRGERIPLDYGALSGDLYRLQYPSGLYTVRMRWTRDFHRPTRDGEQAAADETGDQQ